VAQEQLTAEEQITKLQGQVADLTKTSEKQVKTIEQLNGKLETQGRTLATAQEARDKAVSEVGQKVARIRELELDAEANEQTITSLEAKVRQAEAGGDGTIVVTHEDQLYRVVVPQFHFEGRIVKAEELASDAETVAKLVKAGSGLLEKVAN
jgi:predicted RNase H-like nuclease (RuvC/YqgF family)